MTEAVHSVTETVHSVTEAVHSVTEAVQAAKTCSRHAGCNSLQGEFILQSVCFYRSKYA